MNNDEIRALLRELKERSDEDGSVKSPMVHISFADEEPERKSSGSAKRKNKTKDKTKKKGLFGRKHAAGENKEFPEPIIPEGEPEKEETGRKVSEEVSEKMISDETVPEVDSDRKVSDKKFAEEISDKTSVEKTFSETDFTDAADILDENDAEPRKGKKHLFFRRKAENFGLQQDTEEEQPQPEHLPDEKIPETETDLGYEASPNAKNTLTAENENRKDENRKVDVSGGDEVFLETPAADGEISDKKKVVLKKTSASGEGRLVWRKKPGEGQLVPGALQEEKPSELKPARKRPDREEPNKKTDTKKKEIRKAEGEMKTGTEKTEADIARADKFSGKMSRRKVRITPTSFMKEDFESDAGDFREDQLSLTPEELEAALSRTVWQNLKQAFGGWRGELKSRGIAGKEMLMIITGIALVCIILFTVMHLFLSPQEDSENVTADEGLRVTVVQEPESWCTSGSVTLNIRADRQIQSITVDGKSYETQSGSRAEVTLEVSGETVNVMVVTDERMLTASVEVPMIDTEAPSVSVKQESGTVTLTAADSRSGLESIYYGAVEGFNDVPQYEKYTGPFRYQQGKIYYYYAKDLAGNTTVPVRTTMEPAGTLALNAEKITLFPGDSFTLTAVGEPAGSYVNHVQMTTQDTDVISLDEKGQITALKEGDAAVTVSADGMAPVSCTVRVRTDTEVTLTALGDCTLGTDAYFNTDTNFDAFYQIYGGDYFFQNVKDILSEDDITFANFEGTLTTSDSRENKEYAFKGDSSYAQIVKNASIDSVTLANNHSSDYGAQSLTDTEENLTAAGVDYCIGDKIIVKEVNGVKVGLIGIYVLDEGIQKAEQVQQTIAAAKSQGAQIVVVAFHWGTEKSDTPDETQVSLAHTAIDNGADLVVGHHPHVLQGIELYQGKYIAYSLGNFCFGGNSTPSDLDTMIFQTVFYVAKDGTVSSEVRIIPCSISSADGWNNYQPTPAEGSEADRIMEKLNERSAQFGQSFEAYTEQ